ncbi:transmembrane protein 145-like [Dendronephthya gigantea]|uniref:transmembrane protein 145-like n=1 Tax=Dendronephthya gigantea TaxID=151771 RepID=UPI00106DA82B|nr:transmembrane protein 145-like [Dendronephthya gigantea]
MSSTRWVLCVCAISTLTYLTQCLILDGEIATDRKDWQFVARFCFRKSLAKMTFHFVYPEDYCCQNVLLYFDNQWKRVYPQKMMNCSEKERALVPEYNQKITLSGADVHSGCYRVKSSGGKFNLNCGGRRSFISARARWWYIAVSNCKSSKGLRLKYNMVLTNGETFWRKHFSADEQYILETDIVFLVSFVLLSIFAGIEAKILASRKLFHYTFKLFLWSIFCEVFSLVMYVSYYTDYGLDGKPNLPVKVVGQAMHFIGHIVFLIMLILLAKGWTVTRGRMSSSGQVKLSVFSTLYCVCFIILFIYEQVIFDPGRVLYIYESPAGIGICILRVVAWCWFCYATFFTLKHFPKKTAFYYPFWFMYSGWFLVGPTVILFAAYVIEDYQREQIVNGIEFGVSFLAHAIFLVLTRPAAANTNFPFHMRTCQIGISRPNEDEVASGYAYAPDSFVGVFTTDTFAIFQSSSQQGSSNTPSSKINSNNNTQRIERPIPMTTISSNSFPSTTRSAETDPPPSYRQATGLHDP